MSQNLVIHTTENARISIPLGGALTRGIAFVLDLLILLLFFLLLSIAATYFNSLIYRIPSIAWFRFVVIALLYIFMAFFLPGYFVIFEVWGNGQTPAKWWYSLQVVSLTGQKIGFFSSLIRNFLRIADFFPFLFLSGVISILVTEKHQRIGDLISGTVVISKK